MTAWADIVPSSKISVTLPVFMALTVIVPYDLAGRVTLTSLSLACTIIFTSSGTFAKVIPAEGTTPALKVAVFPTFGTFSSAGSPCQLSPSAQSFG